MSCSWSIFLAVVGVGWSALLGLVLVAGRQHAKHKVPTPRPVLFVVDDVEGMEAQLASTPRWLDERDPPHPSRRR